MWSFASHMLMIYSVTQPDGFGCALSSAEALRRKERGAIVFAPHSKSSKFIPPHPKSTLPSPKDLPKYLPNLSNTTTKSHHDPGKSTSKQTQGIQTSCRTRTGRFIWLHTLGRPLLNISLQRLGRRRRPRRARNRRAPPSSDHTEQGWHEDDHHLQIQ